MTLLALLAPAFAAADLVFTSDPPLRAEVDRPYVYTMTAADDDDDDDRRRRRGPPVRFSAVESPPWLAFDGVDTLSGTPRDRDVGDHRVRVNARRRGETASQTFTITVRPAPAPEPPDPQPVPEPPDPQPVPPSPPGTGSADLGVSISVSPNPVLVDAPHLWSVAASNLGESDIANLELSIVLDAPASYRLDEISDPGCAPSSGARVTCRWSALAAGASHGATLQGRASAAGTVTATAAVSILDRTVDDVDDGNDRAAAVLNVTATPTVGPIQTLAVEGARGLAVADLDGDGFDDLAVAAASAVLVFMRSPDDHGRPFGTAPLAVDAAAGGAAIAAGDIDANGGIDLAVARPDAASVVLFAAESGGFETVTLDGFAGARAIAIADVDGDSLTDVVLANDATIVVYRSLGARLFTEPETIASRAAGVLTAADLTGEGRAELAAGGGDAAVEVYRRDADGYVLAAAPETAPSSSLALADVDGDGVADLAVGSRTGADGVLLTRNGGSLSFAARAALGDDSATARILLADFDADGGVDVATIGASGVHRIHRHDGVSPPGFELQPHRFAGAPDPVDAVSGRFDFDAIPDVAVATPGGVEIFVNVGQPLPPGAPRLVLNGESTVILTVGDEYVDPGASAFDDVDGNLTSSVVVTNPVDTQTIGSYVVTYEVEDSSGNKATASRMVEVRARAASGGGGGGIVGLEMLALLCLSVTAHRFLRGGRAGLAEPGRLSSRPAGQGVGWKDRSAR